MMLLIEQDSQMLLHKAIPMCVHACMHGLKVVLLNTLSK
jgi:hypothetical protein